MDAGRPVAPSSVFGHPPGQATSRGYTGAAAMSPRPQSEASRINGTIVAITHPEKVLFPNDGIIKRELVAYYQRIAATMLPHLRGRPIVMERYPDGINGQKSFQKNTP